MRDFALEFLIVCIYSTSQHDHIVWEGGVSAVFVHITSFEIIVLKIDKHDFPVINSIDKHFQFVLKNILYYFRIKLKNKNVQQLYFKKFTTHGFF